MTGEDYKAWMDHMGFSNREAARRLGISKDTSTRYQAVDAVPVSIALACAAIAYGLPPWRRVK